MGNTFRPTVDYTQQHQQDWVPRSPDANGGGRQGMRLVGQTFGEEVLFNALAITDTAMHQGAGPATGNPTGTPFDQVYAPIKTALVTSTLNQAVSLQPVWSRDQGATWIPFGAPIDVPAYSGTGPPESAVIPLSTPSQYLPYANLQATCATAPGSGVLNGWLERLG